MSRWPPGRALGLASAGMVKNTTSKKAGVVNKPRTVAGEVSRTSPRRRENACCNYPRCGLAAAKFLHSGVTGREGGFRLEQGRRESGENGVGVSPSWGVVATVRKRIPKLANGSLIAASRISVASCSTVGRLLCGMTMANVLLPR